MDEHDGLAERFEASRTHLPAVAYTPDTDVASLDIAGDSRPWFQDRLRIVLYAWDHFVAQRRR